MCLSQSVGQESVEEISPGDVPKPKEMEKVVVLDDDVERKFDDEYPEYSESPRQDSIVEAKFQMVRSICGELVCDWNRHGRDLQSQSRARTLVVIPATFLRRIPTQRLSFKRHNERSPHTDGTKKSFESFV